MPFPQDDPIAEYLKKYGPKQAPAADPIAAYQQQYAPKPPPQYLAPDRPDQSYGEDVIGRTERAVNALTFGAYPKLVGLFHGKQAKEAAKARIANQKEEDSGVRTAALNVLPQIPAFLAAGPAAAATRLGRLAQIGKTGAQYGALEAGGHAEGSLPEQLKQTAVGAGAGAVAAPILSGATHGVAKGAQWLGDVTGITPLFTRALHLPLGKKALSSALDKTAADLPAAVQQAATQSPAALAGGPVSEEMGPVVRRGMQEDNALYNIAAKKIKGLYRDVRALGQARDVMFRNGPEEKIPLDDPEINDMLQTKVPIVRELVAKTKAKMRRIGRPLPKSVGTTTMTIQEAADQGLGATIANGDRGFSKLSPEEVKNLVAMHAKAGNTAKLATQAMVEIERDVPTLEFLATLKEALGGGAEALFKRKLGGSEARALSEFLDPLYERLRAAAPEYGAAQDAYAKASQELQDALRLTKGKLVSKPGGGKRVVFNRVTKSEPSADYPGVRAGVKFGEKLLGNPAVNMAGTGGSTALLVAGHPAEAAAAAAGTMLVHAGREASKKEVGRGAAEMARLLLQTGNKPVLADALAARARDEARRRLRQRLSARAAGVGAGSVLDPFLRQP